MPLVTDDQTLSSAQIQDLIKTVRPYSMVTDLALATALRAAMHVIKNNVPGVFVECGAWRGGVGIGMLLAQKMAFGKVLRPVYLLDSFEGLPDVKPVDGPMAQNYQENRFTPENHFNCAASIEEVRANMQAFGFGEGDYALVKGWFDQTVPSFADQRTKEGIALLRLDCDWYDSVKVCLDHLEPLLAEGGVALIDDYYSWDGCAVALHEYMGRHKLPYRLRTLSAMMGVYYEKKCRESLSEL